MYGESILVVDLACTNESIEENKKEERTSIQIGMQVKDKFLCGLLFQCTKIF